ncbi:TolB family protein, partial [Chloroflexota bacterium]
LFSLLILTALACDQSMIRTQSVAQLPQGERWGIYSLNLTTNEVVVIHSSPYEITNLRLNPTLDKFAFSQKVAGNTNEDTEVFTLGINGRDLQRLTNNRFLDSYPAWSPDGSQIAYLTWPGLTLDIYIMASDGSQSRQLYDSGSHDADIDWVNNFVVFTRKSQIWVMNSDGSQARKLTDPPRAGEWGNANLPYGDYDPRICPDGSKVVFERMVNDKSPHGNYDLFTIDMEGNNLTKITDSGFTQGLANWSPSGTRIAYIVTAIDDIGQYDIYIINPDGTENRNVTPASFPMQFLIHGVTFSGDDTLLYFIGEWWSEN